MRTYLGLAWASVRHRPGGWLLLALGVALATVLPVISAGLRAESSVAAVRSVIDGLPPAKRAVLAVTFRDVRGTALADVDHSVRAGFSSAGIADVNRVLTFRPLSAGALTFTLGGVDGLPSAVRLTSGRLPASCQPTSCEVVVVTVPGGAKPADSYDRAAKQLGLVVTGTAELIDQRPTGTGLIAADTPLLLAADPTGLADLESLSLFGRNTAWYGTLDGRSIAAVGAARFTRVLADISESVNATSGPLTINWPSDAVIAASDRATAGADQLAVLGAGSGSLLLGFGIVVAAGMRRRQQLVGRLLTRRGASTPQILITTAIQPLFAVIVGVLAGAAAGRGRGRLARPGAAGRTVGRGYRGGAFRVARAARPRAGGDRDHRGGGALAGGIRPEHPVGRRRRAAGRGGRHGVDRGEQFAGIGRPADGQRRGPVDHRDRVGGGPAVAAARRSRVAAPAGPHHLGRRVGRWSPPTVAADGHRCVHRGRVPARWSSPARTSRA